MPARIGRFAVVGGVNTAVHYSVYLGLAVALPYVLAHLGAMCVATVCSYMLNCRFTFGDVPGLRSFLLFPLTSLANLAMSTASVCIAVELVGVDPQFATVLAGLAATPITFLVARMCFSGSFFGHSRKEALHASSGA